MQPPDTSGALSIYRTLERKCQTSEHRKCPDPCKYLIHKLSYYTTEELKRYTALEAYNQLAHGWVTYRAVWKVPNKVLFLVISKMSVCVWSYS